MEGLPTSLHQQVPHLSVCGVSMLTQLGRVQEIKGRSLDQFYNSEEDMLGGKVPFASLLQLLQVGGDAPAYYPPSSGCRL